MKKKDVSEVIAVNNAIAFGMVCLLIVLGLSGVLDSLYPEDSGMMISFSGIFIYFFGVIFIFFLNMYVAYGRFTDTRTLKELGKYFFLSNLVPVAIVSFLASAMGGTTSTFLSFAFFFGTIILAVVMSFVMAYILIKKDVKK